MPANFELNTQNCASECLKLQINIDSLTLKPVAV